MATAFHLEILTPERVLYSGEAEEVSLRSEGGEIAFLAHHEDYIGAVDITAVRIEVGTSASSSSAGTNEGGAGQLSVAVHGGFVEVNEQGVTILAGVGELASEIDVERAQRALEAAGAALGTTDGRNATDAEADHGDDGALTGARLALLAPDSPAAAASRARIRLEVARGPHPT